MIEEEKPVEIEHLRKLISVYRNHLRELELQAATLGPYAPTHIPIQIRDINEKVATLENQISTTASDSTSRIEDVREQTNDIGLEIGSIRRELDVVLLMHLVKQKERELKIKTGQLATLQEELKKEQRKWKSRDFLAYGTLAGIALGSYICIPIYWFLVATRDKDEIDMIKKLMQDITFLEAELKVLISEAEDTFQSQ